MYMLTLKFELITPVLFGKKPPQVWSRESQYISHIRIGHVQLIFDRKFQENSLLGYKVPVKDTFKTTAFLCKRGNYSSLISMLVTMETQPNKTKNSRTLKLILNGLDVVMLIDL